MVPPAAVSGSLQPSQGTHCEDREIWKAGRLQPGGRLPGRALPHGARSTEPEPGQGRQGASSEAREQRRERGRPGFRRLKEGEDRCGGTLQGQDRSDLVTDLCPVRGRSPGTPRACSPGKGTGGADKGPGNRAVKAERLVQGAVS